MTGIVLAMLWRRRGQAVAMALLAMFAVAASVAAPAYLRAADRAVAAGQVRTASPAERALTLSKTEDDGDPDAAASELGFTSVGPALAALPGFTQVYAAEFPAIGIEPDNRYATRFVYRQDACSQLRVTAGRCAGAVGEVVLGTRTAQRLGLGTGDRITLTYAQFSADPDIREFVPEGLPENLTVTGLYEVPDPEAGYWGTHGYFVRDLAGHPGEPAFVTSATLAATDHGFTQKSVDSTAGLAALAVDNLDSTRAGLAAVDDLIDGLGGVVTVSTGLPELIARIDSGRAVTRLIVPVIAVPLVVLACFVIFLAAGAGVDARRPELAVVALRGVRWWERWWLATGENVLAILAGAVAGCVVGQLAVTALAALLNPGVGADAGFSSLRYAPVAALAAVLAALLAQRRDLVGTVTTLLRRIRTTGNTPPVLEVLVAVLAVVTGAQLWLSGGDTSGVGLAAPALIILAVALLLGRVLMPLVTLPARRALGRGRLGPALAGFQLTRRPGAQRIFALVVAASAVTAYAACATGTGVRDREVASTLGTGADRVVSVAAVGHTALLRAVRAVDPEGRFAMAVAPTGGRGNGVPGLAVDSSRLAAVANWYAGPGPAADEVARALRPAVGRPVVLHCRDVTVAFTASEVPPLTPLGLDVLLTPLNGEEAVTLSLPAFSNGPNSITRRVPACAGGCRLGGLRIVATSSSVDVRGRVVVTRIGTINPDRDALTPTELRDPTRWRLTRLGSVAADPAGLAVVVAAPAGLGSTGTWLQPTDVAYPLPAAVAGSDATDLTGLDAQQTPIARAATLRALPRLGTYGALVDLELAVRSAADSTGAAPAEVWLNAAAPADVLDRLQGQGLVVTDDLRAAAVRERLDRQGPALALWFYVLAGVLVVVLAAGALLLAVSVDAERRTADLAALRVQGLRRDEATRAALWSYPLLVLLAVPAGTATGVLGYGLTGWALPLEGLEAQPVPIPLWPHWWVVAAAAVAVLVVLGAVAVLAGRGGQRSWRVAR